MKPIWFLGLSLVMYMTTKTQSAPALQLPAADTIYLKNGGKIAVEAMPDSTGRFFFKPKKNSVNSLSIELTYIKGVGTMLKIQNESEWSITYKAEMYSYKENDFVETSTLPLQSKISAFETWPYKIDKIRLTDFYIQKAEVD